MITFKEVYLLPYPSSLGPSPATCKNTRKKKTGFGPKCQLYSDPGRGGLEIAYSRPFSLIGDCFEPFRSNFQRSYTNVDVNEDSPPRAFNSRAWCDFSEPDRRRQRGFAAVGAQFSSVVEIPRARTSTSTRIRRLGRSIFERGTNSRSLIVDVNEDSPPWALNSHAWWKFREPERRRHRRFAILLA